MDTLTLRAQAEPAATLPVQSEPDATWRDTLRHPVVAFQRLFHIEFELDGCILCDDDSLHADLIELFERGDAPTARPEA